jgi:hypothetical protein
MLRDWIAKRKSAQDKSQALLGIVHGRLKRATDKKPKSNP